MSVGRVVCFDCTSYCVFRPGLRYGALMPTMSLFDMLANCLRISRIPIISPTHSSYPLSCKPCCSLQQENKPLLGHILHVLGKHKELHPYHHSGDTDIWTPDSIYTGGPPYPRVITFQDQPRIIPNAIQHHVKWHSCNMHMYGKV